MVIDAAGITAPDGSVTIPVSDVVWPNRPAVMRRRLPNSNKAVRICIPFPKLTMGNSIHPLHLGIARKNCVVLLDSFKQQAPAPMGLWPTKIHEDTGSPWCRPPDLHSPSDCESSGLC